MEWAYTDGSCQISQGKQVTGAGTYHPATSTPSFFLMGITNTINRAELVGLYKPAGTAYTLASHWGAELLSQMEVSCAIPRTLQAAASMGQAARSDDAITFSVRLKVTMTPRYLI